MTRHQTHFQSASSALTARSSHRVLETPRNNAARSRRGLSTSRHARRRGQALLISVLLMVFAAILGATFVTVVALNLSQTARSSSVNTAREAANSGLQLVNEQLTNSINGERWRPYDPSEAPAYPNAINVPPTSIDPSYSFYYTDYERSQGWDQNDAAGFRFAKFPDPRSKSITGNNTPTYLTKVEPVTSGERAGQLEVTVIGRAPNEDAASFKLTAYKATSQSGNFTTPALFVSNWNYGDSNERNKARLSNPATAPTVDLMGGLKDIDSTGGGATVATDNPVQENSTGALIYGTLNLLGKTRFNIGTGLSRLEATGNINTSGATTTAEITDGSVFESIAAPTTLRNRVLDFNNSNDPTSPTGGTRIITPSRIDTPDSRWLKLTKLSDLGNGSQYGYGDGVYINNPEDVEKVGVTNASPLPSTSPYGRASWRPLTTIELQRMLTRKSFGFSTVGTEFGNADVTQRVQSIADPTIGEYYRGGAFHRLSWPRRIPSNDLPVGLPLANPVNRPYIFPVVPNVPRSNTTPAPMLLQDPSLEERGVRGWISPTEFLPRGALVELKGNDIIITLEDQKDRSQWFRLGGDVQQQGGGPATNASLLPASLHALNPNPYYSSPDEGKAWTNVDGSALSITAVPGLRTYRMRINTVTGQRYIGALGNETPMATKDFNGVIYAEGNLRVRGYSNRDVTVVSMANIYVDGAITQSGRVALLAKKNVILNPTQFAARPAGLQVNQLFLSTTISDGSGLGSTPPLTPITNSAASITIPVLEVSLFRVGDSLVFGSQAQTWLITSITNNVGLGSVTIANPGGVTLNTVYGESVSALADPALDDVGTRRAYRVSGTKPSFTRNLLLGNTPTSGSYYLGLVHAGQANSNGVSITDQTGGRNIVTKNETVADQIIQATDGEKTLNDGATTYDLTSTAPAYNLFSNLAPAMAPSNWTLTSSPINSYRLTATNTGALVANIPRPLLLTTSVGAYWQQPGGLNFVTPPSTPLPMATSYLFPIGSSFNVGDFELLDTVRESFYGSVTYDATALPPVYKTTQAELQGTTPPSLAYALNAPSLTNDNFAMLRRAENLDTSTDYYVSAMKYDRAAFADISNLVIGGPVKIDVEATIYAQDGSWFVVPMPAMTANSATTGQANRYRRLNYQIRVASRIAQNFMPTALTDPSDPNNEQTPDQRADVPVSTLGLGAQAQWLDATAYPTNATGTAWNSINYVQPLSLAGNQLYLPITPDISIVR